MVVASTQSICTTLAACAGSAGASRTSTDAKTPANNPSIVAFSFPIFSLPLIPSIPCRMQLVLCSLFESANRFGSSKSSVSPNDVLFAMRFLFREVHWQSRACTTPPAHARIACVFLLGGKAFVVGAVVGFASSVHIDDLTLPSHKLGFYP